MGSVPRIDCACWVLTRPLVDVDIDSLGLDHVCPQTAAATICNSPPIAGAERTPDGGWPVYYRYDGLFGTPPRELAFVVREWAQEPPNRTLANELRDSMQWQSAVSSISGDFVRWRRRHPGTQIDDWIADDTDDRRHAAMLWARRLPATPRVLRFLRACAALDAAPRRTRQTAGPLVRTNDAGGVVDVELPDAAAEAARYRAAFDAVAARHPDALPARGLMVTTLVFVRTGPIAEYGVRYDPVPEVRIEGPGEFATEAVLAAAAKVARKHRDWLRKFFGGHALADPGAIHRAKKGAFQRASDDPSRYEYVPAAVERFRQEATNAPRLLDRSAWRLQQWVDRVLETTYDAVRKRRRAAGLPTTPPKRWRETARAEIAAEFPSVGK